MRGMRGTREEGGRETPSRAFPRPNSLHLSFCTPATQAGSNFRCPFYQGIPLIESQLKGVMNGRETTLGVRFNEVSVLKTASEKMSKEQM